MTTTLNHAETMALRNLASKESIKADGCLPNWIWIASLIERGLAEIFKPEVAPGLKVAKRVRITEAGRAALAEMAE